VLVTNQRVIFDGPQGTGAWSLRDVASYQVHADAIVLELRAGGHPTFAIEGDVELAAVILGAALARA
jgi:hypothetical protein